MSDIIERSQTHATFVLERSYPVPVSAVWHALSDNDARDQWFGGGAEFDAHEKSHEFRVGGHAVEEGQWHGGPRSRFHSAYTDIVDQQRIVALGRVCHLRLLSDGNRTFSKALEGEVLDVSFFG